MGEQGREKRVSVRKAMVGKGGKDKQGKDRKE